ncbi:MAG: DUF3667 domain-containing protein [Bacteroidota bacterium]
MEDFPTEEEPLDVTEIRQVKRITVGQVLGSMIVAFNMDRGGVYTAKQLFINPGKAVREYLGANRFHYTPPFRILIITTTLAFLAFGFTEAFQDAESQFTAGFNGSVEENRGEDVDVTAEIKQILREISPYFNFILWTFIPIVSLFSWLFNLKKNFNYAEHLVFQTYLFCISNILCFLFPFDNFINQAVVFGVIYIAVFFYYIYGYREFLRKSWIRSILESILLFFIATAIWGTIVGLGFGIYVARTLQL